MPPHSALLWRARALFVCLLFVDALVCFRWLKDSCLWLLTFVAFRERIIELEAVRNLVTGLETVIFWACNSCLFSDVTQMWFILWQLFLCCFHKKILFAYRIVSYSIYYLWKLHSMATINLNFVQNNRIVFYRVFNFSQKIGSIQYFISFPNAIDI